MDAPFRAAFMSAETGASATYEFQAETDLFRHTADAIVRCFMEHMNGQVDWEQPINYELSSAVKKAEKQVVMATGSLLLQKGELPFLLMISPEQRPPAAPSEPA
ncbi:MAG TPA: hypothetical protein VKD25_07165 [Burkholderiales bacterium]|nr:hypothetical protein [Burkholderiales bacterium]